MKFIHTSDLHIGKVVNGFSMLEEQEYVLEQMVGLAVKEQVDAFFLCGDLYDRSVPPAQAVTLLDDFLTRLADAGIRVYAIAGNHDSGERLGFASRILEHRAVYVEGILKSEIHFADLADEHGTVRIHLLPFARPAEVRSAFGTDAADYHGCMQEILKHIEYAADGRNVILAHQFVVNQGKEPELSDSETRVSVGGADQVEAALFSEFDYVALGHIHGSQQIGKGPVYYSGSPVKYSFSETDHVKSVILGEMGEKGSLSIKKVPLTPVHDMRKIKGRLCDLIREDVAAEADVNDYLLAILTDDEELVDPIGTLRSVYPNVMQLKLERKSKDREYITRHAKLMKEKTPLELFEDFFAEVTEKDLSGEQKALVEASVETAKEGLL